MEILFGIYDPSKKEAKAIVENGKCVSIKLTVKTPKRFYYSLLNDAGLSFSQQYPQYS
jgi:hypothetical protein